MDYCWVYSRM